MSAHREALKPLGLPLGDRLENASLSASAEPSEREAQALKDESRLGIERLPTEPSAPVEVLGQADGVLTFMRSDGGGPHECDCCDGVHVFCRYFEGMPGFNDLTQAARHRNDLEGRTFRVVLQLLPICAAPERKP